MLYDPKWEIEVKADPFSLESLIAWLENQSRATEYDYEDLRGKCLICQYLTAIGENYYDYGYFMTYQDRQDIALARPWTFGAALDRARKALAERK